MINLHRIFVFVEGEKFTFDYNNLDKEIREHKDFPVEALASYAIRLVRELLSPNSKSNHDCSYTCRKMYAIKIGMTDTRNSNIGHKEAVPKYVIRYHVKSIGLFRRDVLPEYFGALL